MRIYREISLCKKNKSMKHAKCSMITRNRKNVKKKNYT